MEKEGRTTWQEMDAFLGRPIQGGIRSDHAFETSTVMMAKLTSAEFAALRAAWRDRPHDWQIQCADALQWASVPRQEVGAVLLEMTQFPNDELAISAADTLREFDPGTIATAMTPEMIQRLQEVADRNPGLSSGAIHRFLGALPLAAP